MRAAILVLSLLVLGLGCERRTRAPRPKRGSAHAPAARGLLDEGFAFACSPDPAARCRGVFPVRAGSRLALLETGQDTPDQKKPQPPPGPIR
jgi:hypothetical protein